MIDFGRRLKFRNKKFFDFNNIHCNSRVILARGIHKNDWKRCIQYFITKDPENSDLLNTSKIDLDIPIQKR